MKRAYPLLLALTLSAVATGPAVAVQVVPSQSHWECVPIARSLSGIQIRGDAHTWWGQAEGRYQKGHAPRRGAVLAFIPHGRMELGHVAAVSKVLDSRNVLVTHSNWSRIDGRRGQIEKDVRVVDVSAANDWSRVRVWYAPLGNLGTTEWPTHGFIYPGSTPPMRLPGGAAPALTGGVVTAMAQPARPTPMRAPRLDYRPVYEEELELAGSDRLEGLAEFLDTAADRELRARRAE